MSEEMTSILADCKIRVIVFIILTIFISGCVTVERRGDTIVIDPWKKMGEKISQFFEKLKGETTEKQTGARDEALKKYGLEGIRQGLIVEPPVITPEVAKLGDKVKQEVQFALLAPEEEKRFNVSEIIVLSSGEITIELIKRETQKPQGIHLSTIQFTIPEDSALGEYTLTTIIDIGENKKTTQGRFRVREQEKKYLGQLPPTVKEQTIAVNEQTALSLENKKTAKKNGKD